MYWVEKKGREGERSMRRQNNYCNEREGEAERMCMHEAVHALSTER